MTKWIHVGVSYLRQTCASNLRNLQQPLVLCDRADPIAVMVPYDLFLRWQETLEAWEKAQGK